MDKNIRAAQRLINYAQFNLGKGNTQAVETLLERAWQVLADVRGGKEKP